MIVSIILVENLNAWFSSPLYTHIMNANFDTIPRINDKITIDGIAKSLYVHDVQWRVHNKCPSVEIIVAERVIHSRC